jgi:hypothetical protein
MPGQIPGFGDQQLEWAVDRIQSHRGKAKQSDFEILWKSGDITWAPYREVAHLVAMQNYCEVMGVRKTSDLPAKHILSGMGGESKMTVQVDSYSMLVDSLPRGVSNFAKTKKVLRQSDGYKSGKIGNSLSQQTVRMSAEAGLSMQESLTCETYASHLRAWITG